jgi:integrase
MLTGARKSEVLNATWEMFDLENGIWTKPSSHTKQRKLHRVPLGGHAINLLQQIKQQADEDFLKEQRKNKIAKKSPYVFPGPTGQPLQEVRRTWNTVCRKAGLIDQIPKKDRNGKIVKDKKGNPVMMEWPNVRLHDLRHSFASILVSSGASLPLIGQMLGHTQVQTTQRYAHLYDDPMREAAELVGKTIALPSTKTEEAA